MSADPTLVAQLEKLVDTATLGAVVEALAEVCALKAEHLVTNWQDHQSATVWVARQGRLEKLARGLARES